jgi:quercetin dioxygenase-like cupin family protein
MKPHNTFERIFREHTKDHELVWHRDRLDRTVTVIESTGWKFQEDNKIPVELKAGDTLHIKANEYHRIIKGQGSLVVEITEHETGNINK